MTPHFATVELQCACGCGRAWFHPGFLDELERLRVTLGRPMTLTSAARCAQHNAIVRGHPRSLHVCDRENHAGQMGALAIDVRTPSGEYRGALFATAWALNWSIGWNAARGFLHLDRRDYLGLERTTFDY